MAILWKIKQPSIKTQLIRNLSFSISGLLFVILFAIDRGVDNWLNDEFERAMFNKAGLLVTLVDEDIDDGVEFEFSDEFMPEFSTSKNLEYYQLWLGGEPFELSESLKEYGADSLYFDEDVILHGHTIRNIILPDGRDGKMITMSFLPQVDSDVREQENFVAETFYANQKTMHLAYAISTEALNETLFLVDLFFMVSLIVAIILVNITVRIVIKNGLAALEELNAQIQGIKLSTEKRAIRLDDIPLELEAVIASINSFMNENFKLYDKQKRVTSDIAHELKTPITELINLSEVAIRFPADKELSKSFKADVLGISQRMKNIVNDIMLLQLSSSNTNLSTEQFDSVSSLKTILQNQSIPLKRIDLHLSQDIIHIQSNKFAFETILNNVICNASFYSPENSRIRIELNQNDVDGKLVFKISNQYSQALEEEDLEFIFDPLWQKDSSRTSIDRFGLGLSIVESFSKALHATLKVDIKDNIFTFSMTL